MAMATVRILLRLTSASIAGLFAARGGGWWLAAVLYLLVTMAPIRARGTRLAFWSTVAFTVAMAMVAGASFLATPGRPYALWVFLAVYGVLQAVQEKMAAVGKDAEGERTERR